MLVTEDVGCCEMRDSLLSFFSALEEENEIYSDSMSECRQRSLIFLKCFPVENDVTQCCLLTSQR